MKVQSPYILQLIPLLISFLLSGLIHGFDYSNATDIQLHDTYLIFQGWQIFIIIFLLTGYIMNLVIAFIYKLNRADYNILLLGFNTIILIIIIGVSLIIVGHLLSGTLLDKRNPERQLLLNTLINKVIVKSVIIAGFFLLIELVVLIKTIRIKKTTSVWEA